MAWLVHCALLVLLATSAVGLDNGERIAGVLCLSMKELMSPLYDFFLHMFALAYLVRLGTGLGKY